MIYDKHVLSSVTMRFLLILQCSAAPLAAQLATSALVSTTTSAVLQLEVSCLPISIPALHIVSHLLRQPHPTGQCARSCVWREHLLCCRRNPLLGPWTDSLLLFNRG